MTLDEIKVALKQLDEVTLLEVLNLHSDEIVDAFSNMIQERYVELKHKVEEPDRLSARDEERYKELTGELTWPSPDQEALFEDDDDGRS